MKKLISDFKSKVQVHNEGSQSSPPPVPARSTRPPRPTPTTSDGPPPVTIADVYRYRYHHGTNLGTIFVLEKWLTGSMFQDGAKSSELDAVKSNVKRLGMPATRDKFERHWREYCSDADLDWLANDAHCNSVRLPIGYWDLGRDFVQNTPFQDFADVYTNAWPAIADLVRRCSARKIGVLIDLHGVPGGANGNDHSGTTSGRAELWSSRKNMDLALRSLEFLATSLQRHDNIIGLQLCNEAEASAPIWTFYDRALAAIRAIDPSLPLYLSDAWSLPHTLTEVRKRNNPRELSNPLVVDTHLYWTFAEKDTSRPAAALIAEAAASLAPLASNTGDVLSSGAAAAVVGEYSSVLSETSWSRLPPNATRDGEERRFGNAQSRRYAEVAAGAFFWTYRMDWMPGGGWGFKAQTLGGGIVAPPWLRGEGRADGAEGQRERRRGEAVGGHVAYWDGRGGAYEHERFEQGWDLGWGDAKAVWGMLGATGGDRIGSADLWVLKRLRESGQVGAKCAWEFEHGLRKGMADFYAAAGV